MTETVRLTNVNTQFTTYLSLMKNSFEQIKFKLQKGTIIEGANNVYTTFVSHNVYGYNTKYYDPNIDIELYDSTGKRVKAHLEFTNRENKITIRIKPYGIPNEYTILYYDSDKWITPQP